MRLRIFVAASLLSLLFTSTAMACEAVEPDVNDERIKFKFVICALAGQSPELMKQVRKELIDQSAKISEVSCTTVNLGDKFRKIGDLHIPPFNCKIGDKYLMINGDVLIYDWKARAGPRPRSSRYLVMANPKWTWR